MVARKNIYKDKEKCKVEFENIEKELGYLPKLNDLKKIRGLVYSVKEFHGGYNKFLENTGHEPKRHSNVYWKTKIIIKEFENLRKTLGRTPLVTEMLQNKKGLYTAIKKKYGVYSKFLANLGYEFNVKPAGYWTKETIIKEFEKEKEKSGHVPLSSELKPYLYSIIIKKYNNYNNFITILGYKPQKRIHGYLKCKENVEKEFKKIKKELGHIPSSTELIRKDSGLNAAISNYHGGYIKFRESLGYGLSRYPKGHLKNKENAIKEFETVRKKFGYTPVTTELEKENNGLLLAINRYHGGYTKFRKSLGYKVKRSPNFYLKNKEVAIKEFKTFVKKFGRIPLSTELKKERSDLLRAFEKYHGGYNKVKEILGYEIIRGYPKDWNLVKEKLSLMIAKFNSDNHRLPMKKELKQLLPSYIFKSIEYFGGFKSVYSKLGYLLPSSIEDFTQFVENDEILVHVVKAFGDDPVTVADIVAVKYADRFQRKDVIKFFNDRPALREYMGKFTTGINDLDEFRGLASKMLPFDRGNKIKRILIKKGIEYALKDVGHKPSENKIKAKIRELEESLYKIETKIKEYDANV